MIQRKIVYSDIALSKRKAIKRQIKNSYGKERADHFSDHISQSISKLKKFPELGISMKEQYDLECDYFMLYVEHNYFIYRFTDELVIILEVFHEKEDFMRQMFGIITTSQDTLDYWGE